MGRVSTTKCSYLPTYLAKPTDARCTLADHIEFDTLTRPQRRILGQQGLLCSPRRGCLEHG